MVELVVGVPAIADWITAWRSVISNVQAVIDFDSAPPRCITRRVYSRVAPGKASRGHAFAVG
eukprot:5667814-Prymnesium_polylepis.1